MTYNFLVWKQRSTTQERKKAFFSGKLSPIKSVQMQEVFPEGLKPELTPKHVAIILDAVGNIDTSGISMLEEVKKIIDRRGLKLVLANPGGEVMKKLNKSKFIETIGHEWIFLTVGEAVGACNYRLHTCQPNLASSDELNMYSSNV